MKTPLLTVAVLFTALEYRARRRKAASLSGLSGWIRQGRNGFLLFSDCAANVIDKWIEDRPLSVFLENSGYTGKDVKNVGDQTISGRLAILVIGANGLALDSQGRLIITAMTDRTTMRVERDGTRTILADRYDGRRFNGRRAWR